MPSERVQRQVDRLLDEADEASVRQDWQTVLDRANAALVFDPENPDARSYLEAASRAGAAASVTGPSPGETPRPAAPEASAATSFANGRYVVERLIGEGGRKLVYLARDTRLDRDVALSVIKTDGLDAGGLERVEREAQAMARLGDHPNVVTVFDTAIEPAPLDSAGTGLQSAGQPYLVSQYMAGGSLEDLLAAAEEHRLDLAVALRICAEIAAGLEYAHARGIVHRDLKPGNVWLTASSETAPSSGPALTSEEGNDSSSLSPRERAGVRGPSATTQQVAKIGDFGLAVALDRSRLTQAGMMVGTVAYMAPEQALGQPPEPRSDLYSLGCILYELLCGRPPFVGDESVAIVTQHLNTPPVAPTWHRPDCPPALETLVLRLLEKDATKRPSSATEVREALASIDVGARFIAPGVEVGDPTAPGVMNATPTGDEAKVSSADPMYRQTFVGREPQLKQLQAAFDNALSGQGSLAMVVGEPGIGKTSLCDQLATYVAMRGGRTMRGNCYEEGSLSLPYLPFVEAMRSYVLERDPASLKSELGTNAGYVARIVSEVRDKVEVDPSSAGDPEDDRWRLLQAVTGFLRNAAAVQPLMLLLEDLHWSDRGTLDLLTHSARNLTGARLLVVGTYRDVEVDRSHPLSGAIADLRRTAGFERIVLRGLSVDEVHRMMSNIRGQEVNRARAEAVHRQTEGNPLFIQEVLRYLVEEGLVVREGGRYVRTDGSDPDAGIPEGLRDVIGKRLSRLSPETNRVLSVAAVIGRDFDLQTLRAVLGMDEDALLTTIEEAVRVGVLEERSQLGRVMYRFAHAFFRQTLYEEMIAPRRLRLHQEVARALEAQYGARRDDHAAELAEHFAQSTDPADLAKAVEYGELAAKRSMAVYAYAEAASHLERCLAVQEVLDPEDKAKRCDSLLALGEAYMSAGESRKVFTEVAPLAFDLAQDLQRNELSARACLQILDSLARVGGAGAWRTDAYRMWVKRADRFAAMGTADRVETDLSLAEGQGVQHGRVLRARAISQARELGNPEFLFRAAWRTISQLTTLHTDAVQLTEEFKTMDRNGVNRRTIAQLAYACGRSLLEIGNRTEAENLFREGQEIASQTRDAAVTFLPLQAELMLAFLDGRADEALTARERILTLRQEQGQTNPVVDIWRQLILLGRSEEVMQDVLSVRSVPGMDDLVGPEHLRVVPLCLAHLGRFDEARAALARWLEAPSTVRYDQAEFSLNILLEVAVLVEDLELVKRLIPENAHLGNLPFLRWEYAAPARLLGDATTLIGKPAEARSYYNQALEVCANIRFRPEIALTRLGLAQLLLNNYPTEYEEAIEHIDFAIAEFREMKMAPSLEKALRLKMGTQGIAQDEAATSITAVARRVQSEQPNISTHAAPDGSVTLLFTDIAGSTAMAERLGDDAWLRLIREHNRIVREQVAAHHGHEVANRGDGFLVVFESPRAGVECAIAIQKALLDFVVPVREPAEQPAGSSDGRRSPEATRSRDFPVSAVPEGPNPPAIAGLQVHIGLHTGSPARDGDNFYGTDVNLAARIADHVAQAGQIMVSAALHQRLANVRGLHFGGEREVELKGLSGKHKVFEVEWQ